MIEMVTSNSISVNALDRCMAFFHLVMTSLSHSGSRNRRASRLRDPRSFYTQFRRLRDLFKSHAAETNTNKPDAGSGTGVDWATSTMS